MIPKPRTLASLAMRRNVLAACCVETMRITSSVSDMVRAIADGSFKRRANLFRFAPSRLVRRFCASVRSLPASSTAL